MVGIGLISFAAVAQFAPPVIGGLYWRGGTREGALAGLSAGFLVWIYTLLLPSFAKSGWLPPASSTRVPSASISLKPQALFGLAGWNEITHCLFWSLTANIGAFLFGLLPALPQRRGGGPGERLRRCLQAGPPGGPAALARQRRDRGADDAWPSASSGPSAPAGPSRATPARAVLDGPDAPAGRRRDRAFRRDPALRGDRRRLGPGDGRLGDRGGAPRDSTRSWTSSTRHPRSAPTAGSSNRSPRQLEAATEELRAANLRLQELDRMKDDFMSSVTHELRTPLASIRAFSEILLRRPRHRDRRAQALPRHPGERDRAPLAPGQPGAGPGQDRVRPRRLAHRGGGPLRRSSSRRCRPPGN